MDFSKPPPGFDTPKEPHVQIQKNEPQLLTPHPHHGQQTTLQEGLPTSQQYPQQLENASMQFATNWQGSAPTIPQQGLTSGPHQCLQQLGKTNGQFSAYWQGGVVVAQGSQQNPQRGVSASGPYQQYSQQLGSGNQQYSLNWQGSQAIPQAGLFSGPQQQYSQQVGNEHHQFATNWQRGAVFNEGSHQPIPQEGLMSPTGPHLPYSYSQQLGNGTGNMQFGNYWQGMVGPNPSGPHQPFSQILHPSNLVNCGRYGPNPVCMTGQWEQVTRSQPVYISLQQHNVTEKTTSSVGSAASTKNLKRKQPSAAVVYEVSSESDSSDVMGVPKVGTTTSAIGAPWKQKETKVEKREQPKLLALKWKDEVSSDMSSDFEPGHSTKTAPSMPKNVKGKVTAAKQGKKDSKPKSCKGKKLDKKKGTTSHSKEDEDSDDIFNEIKSDLERPSTSKGRGRTMRKPNLKVESEESDSSDPKTEPKSKQRTRQNPKDGLRFLPSFEDIKETHDETILSCNDEDASNTVPMACQSADERKDKHITECQICLVPLELGFECGLFIPCQCAKSCAVCSVNWFLTNPSCPNCMQDAVDVKVVRKYYDIFM